MNFVHDRHLPLPITVQARFWLANAHYIILLIRVGNFEKRMMSQVNRECVQKAAECGKEIRRRPQMWKSFCDDENSRDKRL